MALVFVRLFAAHPHHSSHHSLARTTVMGLFSFLSRKVGRTLNRVSCV
jgi:hypothetical protein